MGKSLAEEKRNRAKNSGGIPSDPYRVSLALANLLNELRPKSQGVTPPNVTELNLFHIYFLYLWITNQISELNSEHDIPDLELVSGKAPCRAHCLRRIRLSQISWVEYALPYRLKDQSVHLWQPIPQSLNSIFSYWLTHHHNTLRLTLDEKKQFLWQIRERKLRTPDPLKYKNIFRKDQLYQYHSNQASIDPYLSVPAKAHITSRLHHRDALSYQKLNSDQIRYDIFYAYNRYLNRLATVMTTNVEMQRWCNLSLPNSQTTIPVLCSTTKLPAHLLKLGSIVAFQMPDSKVSHSYTPIPAISFGSTRAIEQPLLCTFFQSLRQSLSVEPKKNSDNGSLRNYYNERTYELALLFVLLTGARPTHHISIERDYCFNNERAMIYDKGRYRTIILCDYLKHAINDYLALQTKVLKQLSITHISTTTIWYCINENNETDYLAARILRLYMDEKWQKFISHKPNNSLTKPVVPYQLRHSFAQHALMSIHTKLTTQQIDLLTGHSEQGEHLEHAYMFDSCYRILVKHLNEWPVLLNLQPIGEDGESNG